ncbi:hypothetical protein [Coraliomargarita parva]|uniref:hypothetical protein n=1 Tax=Coraliomargarita parva TaxID=3014050 RepID=UPI0022B44A9B|nr:hypothetical protein [Coraliomargarita parva]
MKQIFTPILLLFAALAAYGQQPMIEVQKVDFKTTNDKWTQVEVELLANKNLLPDARDENYVEDIKVKLYLGYLIDSKAKKYDYYTSELEIVMMESGDKNSVYFYLPGIIVDRDGLDTIPTYFYVEISVGGEVMPPQERATTNDSDFRRSFLNTFVSKADSEGEANKDLLMPIYLAPSTAYGRISNLPLILRRDVRP